MSKLQLAGSIATFAAAIFVIIAFSTPYWLVSDGKQPGEKKFERLGLWEACLDKFHDVNYRYDIEFSGCRWIFDEEYNIIIKILEPAFFVVVQVFFTLGFVGLLLGCMMLVAALFCVPHEKETFVIKILSIVLFISSAFCTIAVITFGARGDGRDWMPDPDHNFLSWSFALGVLGTLLDYLAAILFFVDSRVGEKRLEKQVKQEYRMEETKNKVTTVI
ncbi:uncharacterized protein LOC106473611 [Limulus polyphemus]|uniref:Uncharacterized protein LOC106473611 n=1 Tax=Limulus polyphemus TaxID=6850 RepID=A0ABM1BVZ9_LIMPO|nr:uncharacterized protein LOC106473611 [Limulus polyphemus]XP_013789750.1 uncharacterized protein LOC106473611 [Limulus polyphemus]XP_022257720.1 uncharacterized protein LOC106473611 [Limulus polyphemus]